MLHVAVEGPQQGQSVRRPLLLHVLVDACAVECVAVLVGKDDHITVEMVNAQLHSDPLVVWDKDHFRGRFEEVLAGKEMDPRGIATNEVEHENAL